jgi:DNA-binding transcriptional ArsR family regulator
MNRDNTKKLTNIFSALGDKTRFMILKLLSEKEGICVSELAEKLGISTAGTSQQLKVLEQSDLIEPLRQGQRVCYKIRHQDKTVQSVIEIIKKEDKNV